MTAESLKPFLTLPNTTTLKDKTNRKKIKYILFAIFVVIFCLALSSLEVSITPPPTYVCETCRCIKLWLKKMPREQRFLPLCALHSSGNTISNQIILRGILFLFAIHPFASLLPLEENKNWNQIENEIKEIFAKEIWTWNLIHSIPTTHPSTTIPHSHSPASLSSLPCNTKLEILNGRIYFPSIFWSALFPLASNRSWHLIEGLSWYLRINLGVGIQICLQLGDAECLGWRNLSPCNILSW